ncbi:hypothetical protein D9M71_718090 [compost metagenome]
MNPSPIKPTAATDKVAPRPVAAPPVSAGMTSRLPSMAKSTAVIASRARMACWAPWVNFGRVSPMSFASWAGS